MTSSELLLISAIILVAHDIKPVPRMLFGLVVGTWGLVFAVGDLFF